MGRSVPRSSPKPTPKPRSGLCPELLADFRIPKPPGCSQGDFFEFNIKFFRLLWLGVASVLKKIVRLHRFFLHHISLESKLNGRQKVKGGNGSIIASIRTSITASVDA